MPEKVRINYVSVVAHLGIQVVSSGSPCPTVESHQDFISQRRSTRGRNSDGWSGWYRRRRCHTGGLTHRSAFISLCTQVIRSVSCAFAVSAEQHSNAQTAHAQQKHGSQDGQANHARSVTSISCAQRVTSNIAGSCEPAGKRLRRRQRSEER